MDSTVSIEPIDRITNAITLLNSLRALAIVKYVIAAINGIVKALYKAQDFTFLPKWTTYIGYMMRSTIIDAVSSASTLILSFNIVHLGVSNVCVREYNR